MRVAFAKDAQPVWFRVLKYIVLGVLIYFLWNTILLFMVLGLLFILGFILHFWYRYKTNGWRKSYGLWKYDKKIEEGKEIEK